MLNETRVDLTHKLRCLYPDSTKSVEDAILKSYYDTWASTARAVDERGELYPEAHKQMLPLPPDDEEHRPCRAMWAVTMERIISGEHVASYELRAVLEFMASNKSWQYHEDCACKTSGWRGYEIRELLTQYSVLANENAKWAFVKSYGLPQPYAEPYAESYAESYAVHDTLFGFYTVTQTSDNYIFTLMKPANRADAELIGMKTMVPLSVKMGEGDFVEVTPEKIMK